MTHARKMTAIDRAEAGLVLADNAINGPNAQHAMYDTAVEAQLRSALESVLGVCRDLIDESKQLRERIDDVDRSPIGAPR